MPPEDEWLANITNLKIRRAYKEDVREFIGFTGLHDYLGLRSVVRSHIIAWRKDMERRGLASATIRRKLSALSSLFARRERLTTFQVLACKIMPERRLRFATISSASLVIRFH